MIISATPGFQPGIEDIGGTGARAAVRLPISAPTQGPFAGQPAGRPLLASSDSSTGSLTPAMAWQIVDGPAVCRLAGLV